jgi:osmotically-inducible protein OsmY
MKTDSHLQLDVFDELKWEPSINYEHIGVSVSEGIVTLSGSVSCLIEKHNAEKAAQRVAGVKAVVDKIEVKIPGSNVKDDEEIAKAIVNQFEWNSLIPQDKIKVIVTDGWVTLMGVVNWDYQKKAAEKLVKELVGVKFVTNKIAIKPNLDARDLREKIEKALLRAAEHESKKIEVSVHGTQVTLSGLVRSFSELEAIEKTAWGAPGITEVHNHLKVLI